MRLLLKGCGIFSLLLLGGCGEDPGPADKGSSELRKQAAEAELRVNKLEGLPGEVYRTQVESPINWQPWTKQSMELARESERLVFAMVVMPQQATFKDALKEFAANENIADALKEFYVPVLVDGDTVREMGILASILCSEIKINLQLPLMVWMTADGNPVAWIPLSDTRSEAIEKVFMQSHSMVGRVFKDDSDYVYNNSAIDQENRRVRLLQRQKERKLSSQPEIDSVRALRELTALYDPLSRTFDGAGGLFPSGSLELLSMAVRMEGIPDDVLQRSKMVLGYLLSDLLSSAMFDPLDGGVYSSRLGASWALPQFHRDCVNQARVAMSLMEAYEATGNEEALDRALGIINFAERHFRTEEGLFAMGSEYRGGTEKSLWLMSDLVGILSEEEMEVWVRATGMQNMGNLPSEVDPMRKYFRANSFSHAKSAVQIAEETGIDLKMVEERIASSREKLLKLRDERTQVEASLGEANCAATFRMVSAYAAAYRVTGDEKFLERAVKTMSDARIHFADGPKLKLYAADEVPSLVSARAFVYGLAINASLDVGAASMDESWLSWADELATTAAEIFNEQDYLQECPKDADLLGLPIADLKMVFDDSSTGLISMAEARMAALDMPMLQSFVNFSAGLPTTAVASPIIHTDVIQAALLREYGAVLHYGSSLNQDMKQAISRVSPKVMVTVPDDDLGSGAFKVGSDEAKTPISQPEEIYDRSLPNGEE